MIKVVIFDVDGVLIDSVPLHFQAWKKAFAEVDVAISFSDYIEKINGLPRLSGVKNIIPHLSEEEQQNLAERKQIYLLELTKTSPIKPLPGVINFLKILKKRNINRIAASSSKNARTFLEKAGIADYFDHIVTGNDFVYPKPHPDIFLTAARKVHIAAGKCLVIEDAAVGLKAANNANMFSVGINNSADTTLGLYTDVVLHSLEEYQKIMYLK